MNENEEDVIQRIGETISELTYIYQAMNNNIIISVDGTEYHLSEVSNLGNELILHAEVDLED